MKKGILGILGALALFGCGGGGGHSGNDSSKARVAYVNASPDTSDVAFRLNGDPKAADVVFGTATGFSDQNPGDYDVAIRPTSGSDDLWSESHTFSTNTDTLAIAIGLQSPLDTTQTPAVPEEEKRFILAFGSVNRQTPVGNRARLFVVHALVRQPGTPTPGIDFRTPGDTPQYDLTGLAFGSVQTLDVDSGPQTFQVRQTNTDQVFVAAQTLTLAPGKIYVALVSGEEGVTGTTAPSIRLIPLATRD